MDITDITSDIDDLERQISSLESALKPLTHGLNSVTSKLPVLDQAKFQTLAAYAIESLLFSSLRLNSTRIQNHNISQELTRIKQYFDKIQKIETPPPRRQTTVNTEGAARVIRAGLDSQDEDRLSRLNELIRKEREKAASKAVETNMKPKKGGFDNGIAKKGDGKRRKHQSSKRN